MGMGENLIKTQKNQAIIPVPRVLPCVAWKWRWCIIKPIAHGSKPMVWIGTHKNPWLKTDGGSWLFPSFGHTWVNRLVQTDR